MTATPIDLAFSRTRAVLLTLAFIRIEPERRRLGLSLKQIVDGSDVEVSETPKPSEEVSDGFGDIFEDSE